METVRLPFNQYAYAHLRTFETTAGLSHELSAQFEKEISRSMRGIYLGVYEERQLVGVARVVPQPLGAVLLDVLHVFPTHPELEGIETRLLEAARQLADEQGRPLSVIADRDTLPHWTGLGFRPDRRELLTLTAF